MKNPDASLIARTLAAMPDATESERREALREQGLALYLASSLSYKSWMKAVQKALHETQKKKKSQPKSALPSMQAWADSHRK